MQSPARLSAANVSVADDVDPGEAVGLGEGQGYHPLPTSGDATNPQDEGPFAGYDPQDNGPPAGDNDEGEDEGTEEEGASPEEGYTCHPTTWDEAKRIVVEGTAEERYGLVRDILLAALEGFGDQVGDLADLASDLASKAFEEVTEYLQDPLGYLQDTLDSALQMASDAMDYMGDVDNIIDQLKELFKNKDALIDELKNGVGQELYNDYVAPVLCGPVDMMKLITQNVGLGVPAKAVKVFNKLRKAMGLPEFPDTPDRPDRPDGPDGPDRPDDPNNPDRPNNPDDPNNPDRPNNPNNPEVPDGDGGNTNNPDGNPGNPSNPDGNGGNDPDSGNDPNNPDTPLCYSFPAGTPILTPAGLKPIETLRVGDQVWSRSDLDFSQAPQRITQTFSRVAEGYWSLTLETGKTVTTTAEHPLWQQGVGWIEARHVEPYAPYSTFDDDLLIIRKQFIAESIKVYNFSIENTPSYFAGDDSLWVHNATCLTFQSTTEAIRDRVRLMPVRDPVTGRMGPPMPDAAADHIFPVKEIMELEGFKRLTVDQQKALIHDIGGEFGNFQPMSKSYNSSKGSKLAGKGDGEWHDVPDGNGGRAELNAQYMADLRKQQNDIAKAMKEKIENWLK